MSDAPSLAGFDPVQILCDRTTDAIVAAFPQLDRAGVDPAIAPGKNPKFGDFQCNAAMALGKQLGKTPREVAGAIAEHLAPRISDIAEPLTAASIAGPGFINLTLRLGAIAGLLARLDTPDLGLPAPSPAEKQTVVVDLCGVNLAKEMHVGHLRATVIGDTLARVMSRLGHAVTRQNHVGDWGLPIAMVTARLQRMVAAGKIDLAKLTLADLDSAYKVAQRECSAEDESLTQARRWHMGPKLVAELEAQIADASDAMAAAKSTLVKLQAHDPAVFAIWQRISDVTMEACLNNCARLNAEVKAEHSAGESSYSHVLAGVVEDLVKRGIAVESDGALVVRLEDKGIDEPCIIRKSDGGYIYATTDVAAVRHRVQNLRADRVIYAVDARQSLHFRQVFLTAEKAGYTMTARSGGKTPASLEHAAFGMMLGMDGKPFKTRSGQSAKLADLIDDAEERALAAVREKNPELPQDEQRRVASAVAVAAIRYADLSSERTKDYVFSLERMVQFEGNTGPYLLNALVRITSIFRKAGEEGLLSAQECAVMLSGSGGPFVIAEPQEKALALVLLKYPGAVRSVGETLLPHRLCQFLYELSGAYASFYEACHVLKAPDAATRAARLRLCALTRRVLADGLTMLGVPLVERM